ncbi:SDR family oxidoreductase [Chrysiogenes arsenatis]|uniref:SDR family oxidoreductase n=1 Tax=Chrysiogenes arsenatis TaxID=309797 RepID=UPI0003F7E1DF|nr:SDR family oxidoreductase [Chrysiogenes arsenatis]
MEHKNGAIITGGSERLGREMACALAKRGYAVACSWRSNQHGAEETVALIERAGGKAISFQWDAAAVHGSQQELFESLSTALGASVTVLVNNASFFEPSSLANVTFAHVLDNFQVHLFAPMFLGQGFYQFLQAHDSTGGHMINICDQRIYQLSKTRAAYELSKKSLAEFTRMAALTFADRMRVNSISPGPILRATTESDEEFRRLIERYTPLGRQGSAQHCVAALEFLLQCDFIHGSDIPVDGGEHLVGRANA